MSARQQLADTLRPLIPVKWRLVDTERAIDTPSVFTLVIRQRRIAPAANLLGATLTTFVVTLISPTAPTADYEDALDAAANILLMILLKNLPQLEWSGASKVIWNDRHPAYDFDVTVVTNLTP